MKKRISRRAFALQSGLSLLALSVPNKLSASSLSTQKKPLSDKFLAQLPKWMELASVPGVAIAVIENGRLSWKGDYGVKNADTKEAVTPDTVFQAASLSKPVFAYAVLRLKDESLIDLDRPLINYLPGDYVPDEPRAKSITARHVFSHSSGLQNWRFSREQKLQLAFAPGERFSYSGEGFFYLQRAIEKITGLGFEQFMREKVFQPFGMKQSSYFWLSEYDKLLASGHNNRGQASPLFFANQIPKMVELATKWDKPLGTWKYEDMEKALPLVDANLPALPNFMPMNAAGSLQTTTTDYAQFVVRMLNQSNGDKFSLKTETMNEMLSPQIKINSDLSWGLGIGLENQDKHSYFWHWGDNGNFKTFVIGNRANKWGIVIFTNGRNGHKIWERIVRQATGYDHASFLWV